jgi:aspartate aminotransferase
MVSLLNEIPGAQCDLPGGAFYAFPDFSYYLTKSFNKVKIKDSFDLSDLFLKEAQVVTVPGDGFGAPGHIRFSYPVSSDSIRNGLKRITNILEKLI